MAATTTSKRLVHRQLRRTFGIAVENYEPTAWAEELIEPARTVDHPRLASLCAMAAMCYIACVINHTGLLTQLART